MPDEAKRVTADLILYNGRVMTLDPDNPEVRAVAVKDGRFLACGNDEAIAAYRDNNTKVIDLHGRTAIPGLNDSHIHVIRGGLNFNMELRWDGVPSLSDAMAMLKQQAERTPAPQWVRVVGGWNEFQFAEGRGPTLEELNDAAPNTPVFVLHLYDSALLNAAALRAVGYTKNTPNPPGAELQRDRDGNPTGMLIARPNAGILYATLAKGPELELDDKLNSTRHFLRELNRLGLTSAIDAGGGHQSYPEDYEVIFSLARRGELTLRIAYNLFTQNAKKEIEDFSKWVRTTRPGEGDDFLKLNGAGEMLVFSAADFEDFLEPRPDLDNNMETELEEVVRLLVRNRWPFRIHATYNESISRFLSVFEKINAELPFAGLHWFFDHCETITPANLERTKALGGGIAIQHRMAYQGEYFIHRYGAAAAENTPPIRTMLEMGLPVSAGTDATRVASYNPFVALYWMTSGRTIGGTSLYPEQRRLSREEALRLYTIGGTWFSNEEGKKGAIAPGQFADLAVLTEDYFSVAEERIKWLESVLTIVNGKPVYGAAEFSDLAPPMPPASPDWSPVRAYGGYASPQRAASSAMARACSNECRSHCLMHGHHHERAWRARVPVADFNAFWGALGCSCFAF